MMQRAWNSIEKVSCCFLQVIRQISKSHETIKSSILTQIERSRAVTPDWIQGWIWNDAQNL